MNKLQADVMIVATKLGFTLWRNNTGMGWTGKVSRQRDGSVLIRNPRPLHCGLCTGSSDLIGLRRRVITEADVGSTVAQFVALELKVGRDSLSDEQDNFLEFVRRAGGIGIEVRGVEDIEDAHEDGTP